MNSFDVFDTLIARRYVNNNIILNHIESEFKLPGFVTARINADTGSRSLQEIYDALISENIIPVSIAAEVMAREITLEIETAIPVKENIDRVNDGDLLISDISWQLPNEPLQTRQPPWPQATGLLTEKPTIASTLPSNSCSS
jgi:hypothetical protein